MSASIIIVTFNSADSLASCLQSLPLDVELIVVDQGSTDETVGVVRQSAPHANVILAGANRGFGAGCNLGAANASRDVLIFLNPDTRVTPGAVLELARAVRTNAGTLVGPTIRNEYGSRETRCRRKSSPLTDVLDLVVPEVWLPRGFRRDIPGDDPVYRTGGPVGYIQGACMAIGRDVFRRTGGFDEEFFLYGEEEILAERVQNLGLPALLEPSVDVVHVGHTSTVKTGNFAVEQYFRSRGLLYQKRLGRIKGTAGALCLASTLMWLWLTAPLRIRVSYRERETAAWCRAALRGLVDGIRRRRAEPPDTVSRISEL